MLTISTKKIVTAALVMMAMSLSVTAQVSIRPYTLVYSENLKGGTTIFGNTIMNIVDNGNVNLTKMNQTGNPSNGVGGLGFSSYGNDGQNMKVIDIDGTAGTSNSSSADLILPAGSNTIKFARLYWGGRIDNSVIDGAIDTLRKVKIRKGTSGAYSNVFTPAANVDEFNITATEKVYQAYVDITSFINVSGAGTYTVADIPVTEGNIQGGGKFGGWTIVVAFENSALPYNSIRAYDGFSQIYNSGSATTSTVTLSGLNVPNNPLNADEAVMAAMTWEGDANLGATVSNPAGDFIKINNVAVSNAMNPVTNFWNGSVTKNGVNVTTKNPNYTNQMGIDIDEMYVGSGYNIAPNSTSVNILFGTEADRYFPGVFTFAIRMKDPLVTLDKSVADENNNGFVEANEVLTYTLSGGNAGPGTAYNAVVVDTLPSNVSYIANTLQVNNGAGVSAGVKTDAADLDEAEKGFFNGKHYVKFYLGAGATGTAGGSLPSGPGGDFNVQFKVKTGAIPGSIINTARITANSEAGDSFSDDGTAIIGDAGGPAPVKLTSFKATLVNHNGLVKWTTESELNNDYFIVQRSDDGVHFIDRGKVDGNGTTASTHAYQYTDILNTNAQVVYYRLKSVDTDGKAEVSKIIAIKLNGSISVDNFNVYPNPFISDLKVFVSSQKDEMATFRLLSFDGKEVLSRKVSLQSGENIVVLSNFGVISKGNYILEVATATDKFIKKVIKN